MRTVLTACLLASTALTSCAAPANNATTTPTSVRPTSTPPTPSPATTTTTPALTTEQAGRAYLRIVKPYNDAMETLEVAVNNGEPLPRLAGLTRTVTKAAEREQRELRATRWPAKVRPIAIRLADGIRSALPHWRAAAAASSREQLIEHLLIAVKKGAGAAREMRERLDLAKYDESEHTPG